MAKKILVLVLTLSVVGGASILTFASRDAADTNKNVVVTTEKQNNKTNVSIGSISNDQAIKMAYKAMKDYMGKDTSFFKSTDVKRSADERKKSQEFLDKHPEIAQEIKANKIKLAKEHPKEAKVNEEYAAQIRNNPTIDVWFTPQKFPQGKCSDFVEINERTREIVNVTAINDLGIDSNWKINDSKVKEASLKFLKSIGQKIDLDTISIKNDNDDLSVVDFKLNDGRKAGIEVSLHDYTVVHYEIQYINITPYSCLP